MMMYDNLLCFFPPHFFPFLSPMRLFKPSKLSNILTTGCILGIVLTRFEISCSVYPGLHRCRNRHWSLCLSLIPNLQPPAALQQDGGVMLPSLYLCIRLTYGLTLQLPVGINDLDAGNGVWSWSPPDLLPLDYVLLKHFTLRDFPLKIPLSLPYTALNTVCSVYFYSNTSMLTLCKIL